jgi:predicted ribosomally synthesized peptide with nif11-like leader
MSVKSLSAFFDRVEGDEALQQKVKAVVKKSLNDAAIELVKIAKTQGFEITPADFDKAREAERKEPKKLSPEEAACVAACMKSMVLAADCCYYAKASMPGFALPIEAD